MASAVWQGIVLLYNVARGCEFWTVRPWGKLSEKLILESSMLANKNNF